MWRAGAVFMGDPIGVCGELGAVFMGDPIGVCVELGAVFMYYININTCTYRNV